MEREILFRGFCPDEKGTQIAVVNGKEYKGERIEGYFFKIWHEYYILWGTTNGIPNMLEVIPETVGQFTGLTDKNGKKIFEGDIVRQRVGYNYTVTFENCRFVITNKWGNMIKTTQEAINHLAVEVIGNIHDDSELLEVKE